jgi:hypothetical protein
VGRFFLTVALLGLGGCSAPPSGAVPATDTCTSPSGAAVDTLSLGAGNPADLTSGTESPFAPLHEGDGMLVVRGGQGASMLGFVYSLSGAAAPTCLEQSLRVTDSAGETVTASTASLTTYAQPDGTRQTHPLWLPASYPATFAVTCAAGGQAVTLHLHLAAGG